MTDGMAGWHLFDVEAGEIPEVIDPTVLPGGGKGRIVALAATPSARAGDWANRAVKRLAREWARKDLRIFLMDLGLDEPSLHRTLDLSNHEGVSDAFLYGASVQRIAQEALDGSIFFASAGTETADPAQILEHPRWSDLAGGFSEADATLLLFIPTSLPGAGKILERATEIVFLSTEGESAAEHLGASAYKVMSAVGPGEAAPAAEALSAEADPDLPYEAEAAGDAFSEKGATSAESRFPEETPGSNDVADYPGDAFTEGFTLAEGFRPDAFEAESPIVEEGPSLTEDEEEDEAGGQVAEPSGEDGFLLGGEDFTMDPFAGEGAAAGGPDWQAGGSGDLGTPEGVLESREGAPVESGPDAPSFGADFVDLPTLGDEETAPAAEAGIESPASDFGDPLEPEPLVPEASLPGATSEAPASPRSTGERSGTPGATRRKPISHRRPPPKKRVTGARLAWGVVLLALVIAAGGTAIGFFNVPGFMWLQERFAEVPYPELTLDGPEPVEPVLRYSLELATYQEDEFALAVEMRNTLRGRLPALLFSLTPTERDGVVTYVLHAGPAVDVVDADNLRGPLGEVLTREDPEEWPVRTTTRGFYLGERETLEEAREYLAAIEADGALGYIVYVSYPDGSEAYEVLSGAFEGVDGARWWQLALREYGFRDVPFIERRGRVPE